LGNYHNLGLLNQPCKIVVPHTMCGLLFAPQSFIIAKTAILANGPPHAEVAAYNIAEVLGCQAESSELDRTILQSTHSPSGNLGRGFDHPAWGCCAIVNQVSYYSLPFFARIFWFSRSLFNVFFNFGGAFFQYFCLFLGAVPFSIQK
jgi:hypothetical protein